MKALTIHNPWATLIALGAKTIETRDWRPAKYRGPLAIHASKSVAPWHMDFSWDEPFFTALKPVQREVNGRIGFMYYPGCIIAVCNLVDCIPITEDFAARLPENERAFGNYNPGRYAWIFKNIHRLKEPVPAKGHQRFWVWEPTEEVQYAQSGY